jgi:molybdopterin molybdotransferase
LDQTLGLVLAESLKADRDYPPFDRAMMDGFAVCVSDAGKTVEVMGEVAAGQAPTGYDVAPGRCVNIMTGAPCPKGTEAVVREEKVRREGKGVTLPDKILPGRNIVKKGSECSEGSMVLQKGEKVSPLTVGVLSSIGHTRVRVIPPPEVALITTGGEVLNPDLKPKPYQIRNSNGPLVEALVKTTGISLSMNLHADDTKESIRRALDRVKGSDLILITGGVSVGKYDLVPQQLLEYGAQVLFKRVRQKPGKPVMLARKGNQLIFGLPGTPLAVHFCYHRYVEAAIRKIMGFPPKRTLYKGFLREPLVSKSSRSKRPLYLLGTAREKAGSYEIALKKIASTADLFATPSANCYIHVPAGTDRVEKGQAVEFTWLVDYLPP